MTKLDKKYNNKGFSLMEVLLTIAVLAVIASFSTPLYLGLQVRNELDVSANTVVQVLRRAQAQAQASINDRRWGAYIEQGSIKLYRTTTNYSGRDNPVTYDEPFDIASGLTIGGSINEVNFSIAQGQPLKSDGSAFTTNETITLTSSGNEVKTITINPKGVITF